MRLIIPLGRLSLAAKYQLEAVLSKHQFPYQATTVLGVAIFLVIGSAIESRSQSVTPISDREAASSGPGHPWQGALGGVNPFSLARITALPLVDWRARGGLPVTFALYHSSRAVRSNPALGRGWLHSGAMLDTWTHRSGTQRAAVIWPDHAVQLFDLIQGIWNPRDGYRDKLETGGQGFVLTMKTSQVRLEFEPDPTVPGRFRLARIVDANGNAVTMIYDDQHRLHKVIDPTRRTIELQYNPSTGLMDEVLFVDAGLIWRLLRDDEGQLSGVTYPPVTTDTGVQTVQVQLDYNARGNIKELIDQEGHIWKYGYNGRRLAWLQPPANTRHERWKYGRAGSVRTFTDPRNNTWRFDFDQSFRLVQLERPSGNTYGWQFTPCGGFCPLPSLMQLPSGHTWTFEHDTNGNLLVATDPAGNRIDYSYNRQDQLTQILEPQVTGEPARHRMDILRDGAGNPTEVRRFTDATNYVSTQYEYDSFGQLVRAIDPLGHAWTYDYDSFGNLIQVTSPMGRRQQWLYENARASIGFTTPNAYVNGMGERTEVSRDEWGRVGDVLYFDGRTAHYSYDARNNLVRMVDSTGETQWTHDANNRLETYRSLSARLNYSYYPDGSRKSLIVTSPGEQRTTTYDYNEDGRLSTLTDQGQSIHYSYNADGSLTQKRLPNGVIAGYDYDTVGRSQSAAWSNLNQLIYGYQIDYRENGLPRQVTESNQVTASNGVTTYAYDFLNQITEEHRTGFGAYDATYRYDAAGNRTSKSLNADTTVYGFDDDGLTVAAQNASGPTLYSWNANAQLADRSGPGVRVRFPWLSDGNLGGVEQFNGTDWARIASFSYNGLGLRTAMSIPQADNQVLIQFLHDGRRVISLVEQVGGTERKRTEYLWSDGLQSGRDTTGNQVVFWPITDPFGSLRAVTDDHGQQGSYAGVFTWFGEPIVDQGEGPAYKWLGNAGTRSDLGVAGLKYNEVASLYYDPDIARSIDRASISMFVTGSFVCAPPSLPESESVTSGTCRRTAANDRASISMFVTGSFDCAPPSLPALESVTSGTCRRPGPNYCPGCSIHGNIVNRSLLASYQAGLLHLNLSSNLSPLVSHADLDRMLQHMLPRALPYLASINEEIPIPSYEGYGAFLIR